jgi:hypothetical protein
MSRLTVDVNFLDAFDPLKHPRGQPKNAGEFTTQSGQSMLANAKGKLHWAAESGFRAAHNGTPREQNHFSAAFQKQRELWEAGHDLYTQRRHATNFDPKKPHAPVHVTSGVAAATSPRALGMQEGQVHASGRLLPPKAAQSSFNLKLATGDYTFYHEGPGDWAASARKDGINAGESGVFACVGMPSGFVDAPLKTVIAFKIPKHLLAPGNIVPDMPYGTLSTTPYQDYLQRHPDLVGGFVGMNYEKIPPSWIRDVRVVRK